MPLKFPKIELIGKGKIHFFQSVPSLEGLQEKKTEVESSRDQSLHLKLSENYK